MVCYCLAPNPGVLAVSWAPEPRVNLVWMEINGKNDSNNMGWLAILNLKFYLVWYTETVSGKG